MKISAVTKEELRIYCKAEDEEEVIFDIILSACKAYIKGQTGLSDEEMDDQEDLTIALLILASDMYDNRTYQQKDTKITPNLAAKAIIDQHCRTLL